MNKIFYFSGTGNSLAISKKLNDALPEQYKIISIPSVIGQEVTVSAGIVGFVFPVYFHDAPDIVKKFIQSIKFISSPFIFAIATCNAEPGRSLYAIENILKQKSEILSLGKAIDMPGNAITTQIDVENKRLIDSIGEIHEIAGHIQKKSKMRLDGSNSVKEHIHSTVMGFLGKHIEFSPKRFKLTDLCSGCGVCKKICPVYNVELTQNRPVWKRSCVCCLACFHWCPKEAIYMNNFFIKDRRKYQHPEIAMYEMFSSKASPTHEPP